MQLLPGITCALVEREGERHHTLRCSCTVGPVDWVTRKSLLDFFYDLIQFIFLSPSGLISLRFIINPFSYSQKVFNHCTKPELEVGGAAAGSDLLLG